MKVAVTGTPGTGKTTATERLDADVAVVHLNEVVREEGLYDGVDEDRDSVVADLDDVREWFTSPERAWNERGGARSTDEGGQPTDAGTGESRDVVVESHLAHHLPVDRVVVLRCHPDELGQRLRARGAAESKVRENAESEALDLVLAEAVADHGREAVYEVDATDLPPGDVADAVESVIAGEREPSAGTVSFADALDVDGEGSGDGPTDAVDGRDDGEVTGEP